MRYTKEQLQGMSDSFINELLHKSLGRFVNGAGQVTYMLGDDVVYQNEGGANVRTNYCNNWNDVMPLAVEYMLCIDWFTDGRCLVTQQNIKTDDIQYQSESPQRAIACCLILVLQDKQK